MNAVNFLRPIGSLLTLVVGGLLIAMGAAQGMETSFTSRTDAWAQRRPGDFQVEIVRPAPDGSMSKIMDSGASRLCTAIFSQRQNLARTAVQVSSLTNFSVGRDGQRDESKFEINTSTRFGDDAIVPLQETMQRIFELFKKSGHYTSDGVAAIGQLDASLDPMRKIGIRITGGDDADFMGLRIYQSSSTVKDHGVEWRPDPSRVDDKGGVPDVTDLVFPGIKVDDILSMAQIHKSRFRWNLGIAATSVKNKTALDTLFTHVALELDLHYNKRNFLMFGDLDEIKLDDVDVVFFGSSDLQNYYLGKNFKIVKTPDGYPLVLRPSTKSGSTHVYNFYHMKGSDFIRTFERLEAFEPQFRDAKNSTRFLQKRDWFRVHVAPKYRELNPQDPRFRYANFEEFMDRMTTLTIRVKNVLGPLGILAGSSGKKMQLTPPQMDQALQLGAELTLLRQNRIPGLLDHWRDPENLRLLQKWGEDSGMMDLASMISTLELQLRNSVDEQVTQNLEKFLGQMTGMANTPLDKMRARFRDGSAEQRDFDNKRRQIETSIRQQILPQFESALDQMRTQLANAFLRDRDSALLMMIEAFLHDPGLYIMNGLDSLVPNIRD